MIMLTIYTLILVVSAYLASFLGGRTLARLSRNIGFPVAYAQIAIPLSFIAFLMVVSLSTGALLAALLMMVAGVVSKPASPLLSSAALLPLIAGVLLATIGIWESPGTWPATVPLIGFLLLSALIFAASLTASRTAEMTLPVLCGITLAASVPLMVAPLVFAGAHSSMALDVSILLAALLGGLVVLPEATVAAGFVRLPLAVLIAYGAIQAMHYGAWPLGIVSLLIWLAGVKLAPRAPQAGI